MKNIENFENIYWSTERVRRKLELDSSDTQRDSEIQEMLYLTAASDPANNNKEYYRPYLVAAMLLSQDLSANRLKEAGDVVFNELNGIILNCLAFQRSVDTRLGWVVPPGFSVQEFIAQSGGVGTSMTGPKRSMRYGGTIKFTPSF